MGNKYWVANYPKASIDKDTAKSTTNLLSDSNRYGLDRLSELANALTEVISINQDKAKILLGDSPFQLNHCAAESESTSAQKLTELIEIFKNQGLAIEPTTRDDTA